MSRRPPIRVNVRRLLNHPWAKNIRRCVGIPPILIGDDQGESTSSMKSPISEKYQRVSRNTARTIIGDDHRVKAPRRREIAHLRKKTASVKDTAGAPCCLSSACITTAVPSPLARQNFYSSVCSAPRLQAPPHSAAAPSSPVAWHM